MASRPLLPGAVLIPLLLVGLSGCLEDPPAKEAAHMDAGHAHDMAAKLMPFQMDAQSCEEGGFVAVYPLTPGRKQADIWELADVREEVGNPIRNGFAMPLTGPAMANWHQGFRCVTAATESGVQKEYIFGWVGNMIKAPAWDPGGADLHFVLAGLGFGNGTIGDAMRGTTNAAISHAYEPTRVTWFVPRTVPRSAVHAIYSDAEKGIYTSYSTMEKYRDFPARTLRFWWQVPVDGSQAHAGHGHEDAAAAAETEVKAWHPVYWDLITTGGEQYTTPRVDSPEVACHMGTPEHGPQGGACQPTLTLVYEHKSLEFRSGQIFRDVTLDKIWIH